RRRPAGGPGAHPPGDRVDHALRRRGPPVADAGRAGHAADARGHRVRPGARPGSLSPAAADADVHGERDLARHPHRRSRPALAARPRGGGGPRAPAVVTVPARPPGRSRPAGPGQRIAPAEDARRRPARKRGEAVCRVDWHRRHGTRNLVAEGPIRPLTAAPSPLVDCALAVPVPPGGCSVLPGSLRAAEHSLNPTPTPRAVSLPVEAGGSAHVRAERVTGTRASRRVLSDASVTVSARSRIAVGAV